MCIGRHFGMSHIVRVAILSLIFEPTAILEIKAVLATLIRQFVFETCPGKEIEPFVSFVVRPRVRTELKSTLPLIVKKVQY